MQFSLCRSQWNGCAKASRRVIVLQYILSSDSDCVLQVTVGRSQLELLHPGCDLTVRICAKHCVFSCKQRYPSGEKLARARDGLGRRRFAVESCSTCAHNATEGSR